MFSGSGVRGAVAAALALTVAACTGPRTPAVGPQPAPEPAEEPPTVARETPRPPDDPAVLDEEARASFRFFWEQATTTPGPGYGLIRDRWPGSPGIASIASVGFGLAALPIGVERGWISREDGEARALGTLQTFLSLEHTHGFFHHFLDMGTGRRAWNSEVSVIDTGLFISGALTAGAYFGGAVERKAAELYERIDWPWYLDPERQMFRMGYTPEKGFAGHWDFYAEQLILYVLAAGSPTHPTDGRPYGAFRRHTAKWRETEPFVHSWFGSIFTYQFSHAWVDFRGRVDRQGMSWWDNSVRAVRSQIAYATDNPRGFVTLGPHSWGLSASDGPGGYNGLYGAPPSGLNDNEHKVDGTIPPYGAVGSVVFAPAEALAAMNNHRSYPALWGEYGFRDAYNLDVRPPWFAPDVIGIDKGIGVLMLENHSSGLIWRLFMSVEAVDRGMEVLGILPGS